jgi:hypothetical protein
MKDKPISIYRLKLAFDGAKKPGFATGLMAYIYD